jgi:AcrR family transcriptional regulator
MAEVEENNLENKAVNLKKVSEKNSDDKDTFNNKRKTRKAIETRNRILSSALELFRTKGFEDTSMRDIADKALVAVGASYYYYSTKEELVLSYYEAQCEDDIAFAQKLIGETRCLKTRLKLFLYHKLERMSPDRTFINILIRSFSDPRGMGADYTNHFKNIKGKETAAYAILIDGSDLRIAEQISPHLPRLMWILSITLLVYWMHDKSAEQRATKALIERATQLVVNSLNATQFMKDEDSLKLLHETLSLLTGFQNNLKQEANEDSVLELKYMI